MGFGNEYGLAMGVPPQPVEEEPVPLPQALPENPFGVVVQPAPPGAPVFEILQTQTTHEVDNNPSVGA